MRAVIRKTFRFDAAHSLPDHAGKCRGLHGHSYRVELCFQGEVKPARGEPDDGMVLDFLRSRGGGGARSSRWSTTAS